MKAPRVLMPKLVNVSLAVAKKNTHRYRNVLTVILLHASACIMETQMMIDAKNYTKSTN